MIRKSPLSPTLISPLSVMRIPAYMALVEEKEEASRPTRLKERVARPEAGTESVV